MVTDIRSLYTSPAGREFTLLAGRYAGINPSSRILDAGCGYGAGVTNLVEEHRCSATAIDLSGANIAIAREHAEKQKVSHRITFLEGDLFSTSFGEDPFDLILAEGGVLTLLGRERGLAHCNTLLAPRGWLAFSDLVLLTDESAIPQDILHIFDHARYCYESEAAYRKLLAAAGFEVVQMSLVPPSGWDNYYAHMARRLEDEEGFFADRQVKELFHREIDLFYRQEGYRMLGYLFGMVRLKA